MRFDPRAFDPEGLPKRLTMFCDHGAESPIWHFGRMVWLDSLPLSEDLQRDLEAWADDYTDDEDPAHVERGRELFSRVRGELEPEFDVVWDHD